MTITIPISLVSEANRREHWRAKDKRRKAQRTETLYACLAAGKPPALPVTVKITRIYSGRQREFDDDGMQRAAKAVRDELANWLIPEKTQANQHGRWADDSDPRVTWDYAQRRGDERRVEVEVTSE